jgi:hypothetical protein
MLNVSAILARSAVVVVKRLARMILSVSREIWIMAVFAISAVD